MSVIFLPRAGDPGGAAIWLMLASLAILTAFLAGRGARARVLAAFLPAARENAARHLLPLAEAAARARRHLERARDPLEPEPAGLDPGVADLLRLVGGMRGLREAGGALWLAGTPGEIAAIRLWTALERRLEELLGASDLARAVEEGGAGEAAGEEHARVRVRVRRWLRGEPGPDAELWLLDAFGAVLLAEIRTLDRLRDGGRISRKERQELRGRLLEVPAGLPDGEAVAAALLEYVR
ncbi:MAG TPA: hypothetical protein VJ885_04180 [Thermoanaerobaculia bacterium]|nr:hypothetical protein [Thermoanaerobaculia bacterium]